jgi:hypothetical protein
MSQSNPQPFRCRILSMEEELQHLLKRVKACSSKEQSTLQHSNHLSHPVTTTRGATSDNQASSPPTFATAMVAWAACWR